MLTQEVTPRSTTVHRAEPLAGAYLGLLAFFVVYCARPEDWIPGLRYVPLAKVAGIFALGALALSVGQARRLPREVIYLFLLFAQLCLTVPFSPVWRGGAFRNVLEFSKVVAVVPVVVLAVTTLGRLRRVIYVQTASVAVIAMVSLFKSRLTFGRLEGALGGIYSNPNDLALAIVLTVPFCLAFMLSARNGLRRAPWLFMVAVMIYTLFFTASRGGLLAFVVTMGLLLREFGIKGGRRYLLPFAALIVLGGLLVAGRGLKGRFDATFADKVESSEDISAQGSAVQRRELLWKSLEVVTEHPLFGVGCGNFKIVSGVWRVAHNSFTELGAEGGLPALILFVLFFRRSFYNLRDAELLASGQVEQMLLAGALRASLVGFAVGALFASVEYHFFPYFLVAYTSALYAIAATQASQDASGQRVTDAPLEQEDHRADRGAAITWGDYERGRALDP